MCEINDVKDDFPRKREKIETDVIFSNRPKKRSNDPTTEVATRKEDSGASSAIAGGCGERILFWAISVQLRKQNARGQRIRK